MSDEHFIEFTAVIGPIPPPFKLHTPDGNTTHGDRAERLFDLVHNIEDDVDASAKIVTEDELDARADALKLRAERDRLQAVVDAARPVLRQVTDTLRDADGGGPLDAWALADVTAHLCRSLAGALDVSVNQQERDHEPNEEPTADGGGDHGRRDDRAHPDSARAIRDAGLSPNIGGTFTQSNGAVNMPLGGVTGGGAEGADPKVGPQGPEEPDVSQEPIATPHEGEQHPTPCGLCGRVSTDWEDAPSMEGGQTVDPWCQPCLMAWDRGRVVGARSARIADAAVKCPDCGNPLRYCDCSDRASNIGGDE